MIKKYVDENGRYIEIGSKYNDSYSISDIIKHIDEDIKKAIKDGEIFPFEYEIRERKLYLVESQIDFTVLSSSRRLVKDGKVTDDYIFLDNKIQEMIDEYWTNEHSVDWSKGNFYSNISFE